MTRLDTDIPPAAVTIRHVAEAAGVSAGTVSRVLNGGNKETWKSSAKRAEEIRRIAQRLGYTPNASARTLRRGQTQTFGLLYSHDQPMVGGIYSEMVVDVMKALREAGSYLQLIAVAGPVPTADLFLDRRLDGCLVHHELTQPVRKALTRAGLPAVTLNLGDPHGLPNVRPDDRDGAEQLARHLLERGHRRIVFVSGGHHYSDDVRFEAMRDVMADAGVDLRRAHWPYERNLDAKAPALLGQLDDATAAVFQLAGQALWATRHLRRRGADLPRDLAIASFTCGDRADDACPSITSVEAPFEAMGRIGATMLLRAMREPDARLTDHLAPMVLNIRESTLEKASR